MSDQGQPTPAGATGASVDWGQLLVENQSWLRRVVAHRLGEARAVDDVMQEVALAAVSERSPLKNPARAVLWLYQVAVRQVLIHRRKAGRGRSLEKRYAERGGKDPPVAGSPLGWLLAEERQALVQRALGRLPERDAEILILKHGEGFSARELADRLGVAVNTIEARLSRARKRLRAELAGLVQDLETWEDERR